MANIRFDNFSGDTVTVFLDDTPQTVEDDGRVTFDLIEKGKHNLRVHRARIPCTISTAEDEEKSFFEKAESGSESLHFSLDYTAKIELNSSKAVVTLKTDVAAKEGRGIDAIFVSYSATATGAKISDERKIFANINQRKSFITNHIKNIFFPAGLGGIIILILALVSLFTAISGNPVNIGGTVFTLPWGIGLTAVASAVCVYNAFCVMNVMKTAKKFSE